MAGYQKRKRDNALREIEAITREHDLSLKEVIQSNHSRSIKAPRFPHHENAALTWTGRGPRSAWYKEARHAGATSKDLKVA